MGQVGVVVGRTLEVVFASNYREDAVRLGGTIDSSQTADTSS